MAEEQQQECNLCHPVKPPTAAELVRRKANREMYSVVSCVTSMLNKMDFDEQDRWFQSYHFTELSAKVQRSIKQRVYTPRERMYALAEKHSILIAGVYDLEMHNDRREAEEQWDQDKWVRWMQYWEDREMWESIDEVYHDAMKEFEALDAKNAD